MFSNLRIVHKALILVLVPVTLGFLSLTIFAGILFNKLQTLNQVEQQQQVLLDLNRVGSAVARAVILVTGAMEDTDRFRSAIEDLNNLEKRVSSETTTDESDFGRVQLKEALTQASLIKDSVMRHSSTKTTLEDTPNKENKQIRKASRQSLLLAMMEFSELSKKIIERDDAVRSNQQENGRDTTTLLLIAIVLIFVFVCGTSFALFHKFTDDILKRLKIISENSKRLATGELLLKSQPEQDEIGKLDHLIHEVNEQLTDSRRQELSVLDNAAEIICTISDKLKFVDINPAVLKLWKYTQEDVLGLNLVSLLDEQDNVHEQFTEIANGGGVGLVDTSVRCKDGTLRDFQWTVSWFNPEQNFHCVVRDVTQAKELERLKQQFTLMVSHDLRSPITSLMLNLGMYLDNVHGELTVEQREELQAAQASTNQLMALINDLLDLGKIESGSLPLQKQKTRAYNICAEAIESVASMAKQANIKVIRPGTDGTMLGDERRLLQATVCLLTNSIKTSPAGSEIKIEIAVENDFVETKITDSGPEIAAEERSSIFDKFRQSQSKSNLQSKTTGLGLAIVKAIITAHGGTAGVEYDAGRGRSFWYRIPKFSDPADEDGDLE